MRVNGDWNTERKFMGNTYRITEEFHITTTPGRKKCDAAQH